ncbi:DNA polymerase Y family protein [Rhodobacteraceae bacterium B1Z28]|uniref:DNA-directed DNA polymerase n=1 Tax=Ruegeria haliotis TaxID=2747601 RepID=A0ABX2PR52_9RHOB|nr:DNA polymerase Y family protein [Ruegeria haliotis]NVO56077.1 DNA polymerase Y family protein [Ruegeria haliotis]
MPKRRILSLWFPRLGAERLVRAARGLHDGPLAVVAEQSNMQVITSLNAEAQAAGLRVGQPVRDAHAMCATLITRPRNAPAEAAFLTALRRWAGKFSPWVAEETPDGLVIDLSGCAHLFGGENTLLSVIETDCADMGLSVQMGIADTLGAAWALARYAGQEVTSDRNGDAISQEARATRARASKRRHWTKGGAAPQVMALGGGARIAAPGQAYGVLSPLPIAALRLEDQIVAQLNRLGLRRIGDLLGQPRASLARRFGRGLVLRLDQAMGSAPEPVSPARPPHHFAVRMTLPNPIGLVEDVMAAIDRMLPTLCTKLEEKGRGVRTLRLEAHRADQAAEIVEVGLARPTFDKHRIYPLLEMKIDKIDAGYGIDMLRLEAIQTEPVHARTRTGHAEARNAVRNRVEGNTAVEDLIGKLGARVGLEAITRRHPAASHIPEKTAQTLAAAWSEPARDWSAPPRPRPLQMWQPEPVMAPETPDVPTAFRWRGRDWKLSQATGPERIAPEWWLDDPNWRSGVRDYWVAVTEQGERLWLFYGHGGTMSAGWFCQGQFG